jgi:chorismate mutase / prephenate dehydratase
MTSKELADLRKSLDDIDAVLVSALGERARLSRQIANVKAAEDGPVRDADRETALLQHRSTFGERLGLDPAFVRRIFREILDDSVRRQQDALQTSPSDSTQELRVGFQGTEGAYGHQAALQYSAVAQRPVGFKAYASFKEMLEAVIDGHVDRAMLPIENTTAGSVYESYDLLLRFNLSIVGEEIVDVRHCLLGVADVPVDSLRRIHSHPQALSQCSEFLSTLQHCEGVSAANTALAARHVRELNHPDEAAIASEEAGSHFGLTVLRQPGGELHPFRRRGRGAGGMRPAHRRQGVDGVVDPPRARRSGPLPQRDRGRGAQCDEARIPAPARDALGIRVLHRRGRAYRLAPDAGGAGGFG